MMTTIISENEIDFWSSVAESKLSEIWDNQADDIYSELLVKESEIQGRNVSVNERDKN